MKPEPIAILCSDLHLSQSAPPARARENWFDAMAYSLGQLAALKTKLRVPIVCAGDIFDKWNPPPELINFAIRFLPEMFAVPGQHDLPYHISDDVHKSAFGTMMAIGRIRLLGSRDTRINNCDFYGFAWGAPPPGPLFFEDSEKDGLRVAIVHAYCWTDGHTHPNASQKSHAKQWAEIFKRFDVVAFGDNHKGFLYHTKSTQIINCGGLMRRKSDEYGRAPMVGILYSDGTMLPHYLEVAGEKFDATPAVTTKERDNEEIESFVKRLSEVEPETFDFAGALRRWIQDNEPNEAVRKMILESLAT